MTDPTSPPSELDEQSRNLALHFPVVGIGASAGGLAALSRLFEHMPSNTGMAFVIVLHLSAKHESKAADILQQRTKMPVSQVAQTVPIEADHVYVIAPGVQLEMFDGQLVARPLERPRGRHMAIDTFFRTLAHAHRERAFAVVLSGADSDGAIGLRDIKGEGGVAIAQAPSDAEYDTMPSTAIATAHVDFVLPAAEIAPKLVDLWANAQRIELPDAESIDAGAQPPKSPEAALRANAALREVMAMLLARTGHDFRAYKRATVLRRLERRLQVTQQSDVPAYLEYLKANQQETIALLHDMLITVTCFFRDREAFEALEREVASSMFDRRAAGSQVRAWSVGCATGEEAYSLAMMMNDHVPTSDPPISVQLFASDIDAHALAVARAGLYPEAIVNDVPTLRLRKYFQKEMGCYRINRALREQILFTQHNILRDPPFSRVDLITCRNLLIYLERDAQTEVLNSLHFALNPGGLLFIGSAESADFISDSFTLVDKRHRIYRANGTARRRATLPLHTRIPQLIPALLPAIAPAQRSQLSELHERLVIEHGAPSVIVDKDFNILHSGAHAARYLHHVAGAPSRDVLKAMIPEMAPVLHPALLQASRTGEHVTTKPLRIEGPAGPVALQITVRPHVLAGEDPVMLIVFSEVHANFGSDGSDDQKHPEEDILHGEIRRLNHELQGSVDDSALSSEALRASNEELQSINEELRSATEELETSKEELQSLNEELTTVNYELKNRVDEAAKVNDNLKNLIASMDIATLFVDRAMNLKDFTPLASSLFNVRQVDMGRSLLDITHHLHYDALSEDIAAVIASLRPMEREIADDKGRWHLMRISPYRTTEDRIDGAVLNLIDITERRKDQHRLRATSERLRLVAESTPDYAIITLDVEGQITSWNKGAVLTFGYPAEEIIGRHFRELFNENDRANGIPEQELEQAREQGHAPDERWHMRKDGTSVYCSGTTTRFCDGDIIGYAKIARDMTDRQLLDKRREELLQSEQQVRRELEVASAMRSEFLAVLSHELKNPLNLILLNAELISRSPRVGTAPDITRAINLIRTTVHAQSRIIDDLLDLSRLTTGKLMLNRTAVEWRPVLERITQAVQAQADTKGIAIELDGDEISVYADAVRLEQIVWNLLTNAIRFTPEGGRITLRLTQEENCAVLAITDTGRGIEPEFLDLIFDMFQQVGQKVSTRRDGGLGIGLALVKNLVELQGGRVKANSEGLGKGATFTVWLPIFLGTQTDEPVSRSIASPLRSKRVLLVDDDKDTLEVLASLLDSEGALVTSASSAEQAVKKAAQSEFDLVLSDIAMPDMDGLHLIRELRRDPHSASWPAIAMSGFGRPEDIERSKAAGFNAHLPKPLSLENLADTWLRLSHQ